MHAPHGPQLLLLPGARWVLLLLCAGGSWSLLSVRAARLLDGLRAACDALSFHALQREEPALEELLPWTGNV